MKKILLLLATILAGSELLSAAHLNTSPAGSNLYEKSSIELTPSQFAEIRANAPTRSGQESYVDFSYAKELYTAYRMQNISSGYVYLAIKIPIADQTPYIGAEIRGVTFYSPTNADYQNPVQTAAVFVTDDISVVPAQTTTATLSTEGFGENYVELEHPFTITGEKPIFIGYRFKYVANTYYVDVDNQPVDSSITSCLVAGVSSESQTPSFVNYSDQMGSLCLSARIFGDNLPENFMSVTSVSVPEYVAPGTNFTFKAAVKNLGANTIQSAKFKSEIAGNVYESDYTFTSPLGIGEIREINLTGIPNTTQGVFKVTLSPVSANDVAIESPISFTTTSSSFNSDLKRAVVIEEATGNWCQYCPNGIVMMEYLREAYPDWVLIAVHGGSQTEPMLVPDYSFWIDRYSGGYFPSATANRIAEVTIAADNVNAYTPLKDYFDTTPGYVTSSIEAVTSEDGSSIDVTAKSNFIFDTDVKHNLSLVIVEDNVGPYAQANYYYHKQGLPQWYDIPSGTKVKFNEVSRAIISDIDAFPAQIVKDSEYEYTANMPLTYTYGKKPDNKAGTVIDPANARVVAIITNADSGVIVGACESPIICSGVKGAISDNANISVSVEAGSIIVKGADNFSVYTLDGRQVSANDVIPGVYIVKTDGKSFKLLVR